MDIIERSNIPRPTALRIISILKENGILVPVIQGRGQRAAIYDFRELLNLTEGKEVF